MKKIYISMFLFAAFTFAALSQVPEAFNYQAVVRDASGGIVPNQEVTFRISILQDSESGTVVYSETHSPTTSPLGLANFKIGEGTVVSGTFGSAGWGLNTHFVKIEIDPAGGSSFNHLGTSELVSVPYAFHAETASNVDDDDADPANELQTMSISGTQLTLSSGGGVVSLPSSGGGDNWGTQSVESDATLTGDGTSSSPLSVVADGDTDDSNELQTISLSGTQLSLSDGGGTVTLPSTGGGDDWGTQTVASDATLSGNGSAADPLSVEGDLTDNQTLSVSGNDLSISNGNTVALPSGSSLWEQSGSDVYYNSGKVGIGNIPSGSIQFQSITDDDYIAIKGVNNSATYGTLYLENNGGGPAADLRGSIQIMDGTHGAGKVLTSDANGLASWETPASGGSLWTQNGSDLYYDSGKVGIGTSTPAHTFTVNGKTTNAYASFQNNTTGNTATDGLLIGSRVGTPTGYLWNYEDGKILFGTRGTLRMTIEEGGDVAIEENLNVTGEVNQASTGTANMLPIAYGTITADGTIKASTGNFTLNKTATGKYEIAISGESYLYYNYITSATVISPMGSIRATSGSGKLLIFTYDTTDTAVNMIFSFIVYKP